MATKKSTPKAHIIKKAASTTAAKKQPVKTTKGVTPGKVVLSTLALAGIGVGGYFLYSHFKDGATPQDTAPTGSNIVIPKKSPVATSAWKSGVFPLVQGMNKNNDVYALQMALLQMGGAAAAAIKNSGGADGSFGNGLANALEAAGLPASIANQAKLSQIIASVATSTGSATVIPPTSLYITGNKTSDLIKAEATKKVSNVVEALSQIQTVADYSKVNRNGDGLLFSGDYLHRTIVTKLFETFGNSATDRPKIEAELLRIGLKKNLNNVWSLSGTLGNVPGKQVITTRAVYVSPKELPNVKVIVLENFIVGREISRNNGSIDVMTIDNKIVIVPENATKTF